MEDSADWTSACTEGWLVLVVYSWGEKCVRSEVAVECALDSVDCVARSFVRCQYYLTTILIYLLTLLL